MVKDKMAKLDSCLRPGPREAVALSEKNEGKAHSLFKENTVRNLCIFHNKGGETHAYQLAGRICKKA
jgi:hypothetical protein